MTVEERKSKNEAYLEDLNIPVNKSLLFLAVDGDPVELRPASEVACRILVLAYLSLLGEVENRKEEIINFLTQGGLWPYVTEYENELFAKKQLSQKEKIELSWHFEPILMLLWVLGKIRHITLPKSPISEDDFSKIEACLPGFFQPVADFVNSAVLRESDEMLEMADLIYRMHWAVKDASAKGRKIPAGLHPGVVYERHYAINWVVFAEDDWDDISTDF